MSFCLKMSRLSDPLFRKKTIFLQTGFLCFILFILSTPYKLISLFFIFLKLSVISLGPLLSSSLPFKLLGFTIFVEVEQFIGLGLGLEEHEVAVPVIGLVDVRLCFASSVLIPAFPKFTNAMILSLRRLRLNLSRSLSSLQLLPSFSSCLLSLSSSSLPAWNLSRPPL